MGCRCCGPPPERHCIDCTHRTSSPRPHFPASIPDLIPGLELLANLAVQVRRHDERFQIRKHVDGPARLELRNGFERDDVLMESTCNPVGSNFELFFELWLVCLQ